MFLVTFRVFNTRELVTLQVEASNENAAIIRARTLDWRVKFGNAELVTCHAVQA